MITEYQSYKNRHTEISHSILAIQLVSPMQLMVLGFGYIHDDGFYLQGQPL